MKKDRFKGYDNEVRRLVLDFEAGEKENQHPYFDTDEMEMIIDFYLDALDNSTRRKNTLPADTRRLEHAVAYAERLFPSASGIRLRKAHLYSIQGRYDNAMRILHELERLEPDNTDVQYALGTVYSALDQPRRAIQYYLQASRDGYQLGTIYGNIGDEYYRMGRLEDSLRYYKKSVARNADEERSLHNLEATYDELNLTGEAIDFFQHFVRQNPYSRIGWFCLGRTLMGFADRNNDHSYYRKAIEAFRYTLTIDDHYFDAYVFIAECQQALNDSMAAVATLRESLDCAEDSANVLFSIATIYMGQTNYQTASIYLKQATERDPYFSEAWLKLAECYDHMGYSDDAEILYQRSLGMNEENDEFWLLYADFLIKNEHYDEAIELLQRGIVNADYPHAFNLRLACCYFHTGKRNMLFNTLIDCIQNGDNLDEILDFCPEMGSDTEVMNILDNR